MAAIQARWEAAAARLTRLLSTLAEEERGAKQQRQQAVSDGAALATRIAELQAAEEQAVEREDYEAAASLSSEQEAAQASCAAAQRAQQAAEALLHNTAEQRLGLVKAQAEAALAATAALQALLESQKQEAAAASERATRAAEAAAATEAAAKDRLRQLAQQEAELQAGIARQQEELGSRQQEEEVQLAEQRQHVSAAHAELLAEVEALRQGCQRLPACNMLCPLQTGAYVLYLWHSVDATRRLTVSFQACPTAPFAAFLVAELPWLPRKPSCWPASSSCRRWMPPLPASQSALPTQPLPLTLTSNSWRGAGLRPRASRQAWS